MLSWSGSGQSTVSGLHLAAFEKKGKREREREERGREKRERESERE